MLKIIDFDKPPTPPVKTPRCRVAMRTKKPDKLVGLWRAWRCRLPNSHTDTDSHMMGASIMQYQKNDPSFYFFTTDLECDTWSPSKDGSCEFTRWNPDVVEVVLTADEMRYMTTDSSVNEILRERFGDAQNHRL